MTRLLRRRTVDQVAPVLYALVDVAAIMAPGVALKLSSDRGGMGGAVGYDLLAASLVIGIAHGVFAAARLRSEERMAVRRADMWIAAVDAVVVLALGTTLLLLAVLHVFVQENSVMADRGYPVVALWVGIQLAAVVLAEATGRFLFWWLEPHSPVRWHR